VVTWDGKDMSANPIPSLGLGDIDLTLGGKATGFLMKLGIDAAGAGDQLRIRLFKDSKTEFSELSVAFPVTGGAANEWAYIPFTDMVGGVSPGAVNAIQMLPWCLSRAAWCWRWPGGWACWAGVAAKADRRQLVADVLSGRT
jgi:hypothetical protein